MHIRFTTPINSRKIVHLFSKVNLKISNSFLQTMQIKLGSSTIPQWSLRLIISRGSLTYSIVMTWVLTKAQTSKAKTMSKIATSLSAMEFFLNSNSNSSSSSSKLTRVSSRDRTRTHSWTMTTRSTGDPSTKIPLICRTPLFDYPPWGRAGYTILALAISRTTNETL